MSMWGDINLEQLIFSNYLMDRRMLPMDGHMLSMESFVVYALLHLDGPSIPVDGLFIRVDGPLIFSP